MVVGRGRKIMSRWSNRAREALPHRRGQRVFDPNVYFSFGSPENAMKKGGMKPPFPLMFVRLLYPSHLVACKNKYCQEYHCQQWEKTAGHSYYSLFDSMENTYPMKMLKIPETAPNVSNFMTTAATSVTPIPINVMLQYFICVPHALTIAICRKKAISAPLTIRRKTPIKRGQGVL